MRNGLPWARRSGRLHLNAWGGGEVVGPADGAKVVRVDEQALRVRAVQAREARLFAADATTRVAARVRLGAGHLRMRAAFVTLADALDAVDLDCPARNVYVTEAALCAAARLLLCLLLADSLTVSAIDSKDTELSFDARSAIVDCQREGLPHRQ